MSSRIRVSDPIRGAILASVRAGVSKRQVARDFNLDERTVRRFANKDDKKVDALPDVQYLDKKIGGVNWRDTIPAIEALQKIRSGASWNQRTAKIRIGDGTCPVGVMAFGDQHIGAISTDYRLFVECTDLIVNTPYLYVMLTGDEAEMAIKLRGVAEVCAQILDPFMQAEFIESWIEEIMHKVICSTWSNHSIEREEKASGNSIIRSILAKRVPFFNGIGHADIQVGDETYKTAINHKFQGVTQLDSTAGCKKYLRMEYPEGEIAIQGDCHRTGVSIYNEGGSTKAAISSGTLNVRSGFAERYFSLKTSSAFPVIALWPNKHQFVPFFNVQQYMDTLGYSN